MALSFTSNKRATQVISDSSGYRGPNDYLFNLDIPNDEYFVLDSGQRIHEELDYFLNVSRSSSSGKIFDDQLNILDVPPNTARRTYLPAYDTYGVLIEEARYNFFNQTPLESKPVSILPQTTNIFACFAMGGTAKVSATEVDIIGGAGSYDNPMFFTLKSAGTRTPFVTLSADVTAVQVEQLVGKRTASVVPSRSAATKAAESMRILDGALQKEQGCIVLHILESKRKATHTASEYTPYFQIKHDEDNYIAANRRMDRSVFTLQLFKSGAEVLATQLAVASSKNKIAVSWEKGAIRFAVNGVSYSLDERMDATFSPQNIGLLSTISTWVRDPGNAALTNLVAYDRALTLEELAKATTSWD